MKKYKMPFSDYSECRHRCGHVTVEYDAFKRTDL